MTIKIRITQKRIGKTTEEMERLETEQVPWHSVWMRRKKR
jgi:hypothetical protein